MKAILALDQGTTSSRALLVDVAGSVLGMAQQEFRQNFPEPGWVEHDPLEIWSSQLSAAREVMQTSGVGASDIAAIGITNQRETAIVWDRETGDPIYNAIVWQDRRTAPLCDSLQQQGHEEVIREKTGLIIDAYFSATKVRWILDNVPDAREKAAAGKLAFGTVDSWLVWNLTGGRLHITDASNASRTMLYNIHTGAWDDELLQLLDIPRNMLPEARGSSEVYGETQALSNVPIPIAGIAGDQQAALFGQRCSQPGSVKNTYGTGCFMLLNTGEAAPRSQHKLITTVAWRLGNRTTYAVEGSIFVAGAVVQWLRDGLGIIKSSSEVEQLALSVPDTGGVYLVPAFVGLGAPHWDAYARGTMVGLTRGTTRAHIARAALESIAYQTADVLRAMRSDSGLEIPELRVDGGATANNLLMQFQSDILQVPVTRPTTIESTALGAAYLAGLAVGFWKNEQELDNLWARERQFHPAMSALDAGRLYHGWTRALERAKAWEEPTGATEEPGEGQPHEP